MLAFIKNLLKRFPFIDLGQENPNSASRRISLNFIPVSKGAKALDAGCREGSQTKVIEERGYVVTSVDIENAYEKCRILDLNYTIPFDNAYFDLIYCSEVIEHLRDPAFTVSEFTRVLAPGGTIILTTPNSYCIWFRILYFFGLRKEKIQKEDHIQFFDIHAIRRLFSRARIYGFWPLVFKFKILRGVSFLSPTFIIQTVTDNQSAKEFGTSDTSPKSNQNDQA